MFELASVRSFFTKVKSIFTKNKIDPNDPNEELGHIYILRQKRNEKNHDVEWSGKINATNSLIKKTE